MRLDKNDHLRGFFLLIIQANCGSKATGEFQCKDDWDSKKIIQFSIAFFHHPRSNAIPD